ncbi:MAG TPA: hypothetical protein VE033_00500 [Acetobacteraceae bacterium]|nr:hypothetical protein [Acetobacteraceae bacterium]
MSAAHAAAALAVPGRLRDTCTACRVERRLSQPFQDPAAVGKTLGAQPLIDPTAPVRDSRLGAWTEVGARTTLAEVERGDYSCVAHDSQIAHVSNGRFCSIASHTRINRGNYPLDPVALNHFTPRASGDDLGADEARFFDWRRSHRVTLGHDVWFGDGVIVLAGISIGTGMASGPARW